MYPPKFDFYRASSVQDAVALLQEHDGAKLLAGGHSLIPIMNLRLSDPGTLIDIGRIEDLKGITKEDGRFYIGALTTHAQVAASERRSLPAALKEAAGMIGDPQVRNRGTVGGNVAHADPASDLPTVFTALGATFHITGSNGSRTVVAQSFFTDLFATALNKNEILTSIEVPAEAAETGSGYAKMASPASRYAILGAAASVTVGMNGDCTGCSVAVGGLTTHARLVPSVSSALVGRKLSQENIAAASRNIFQDLSDEILGDIHASADYRRHMAPVYVERALLKASRRAGWVAKIGKSVKDLTEDVLRDIDRRLGIS
ncbi:MAG: xanthine dehydrogenase family protein subunit M [Candidatus Promineifilaceae bacterium]|nr:xanthine dehydrogenase family protein subunit M [Candidatus Promineifilaceae bacterium]